MGNEVKVLEKIVVMGGGSWGTALAILLAENGYSVTLWEFSLEASINMEKDRENKIYLKGVKFPENLKVTNKIENLLEGATFLIMSIPSQYLRTIISKVAEQITSEMVIVNTAKGLEIASHQRLSEVIQEELLGKFHKNIVVLSGPTHAEEVAMKMPSAIVAASKDKENAKKVQKIFSNDYFRVYINSDIAGVEIGGSLKNCIAIAAGIVDGMGFGDNSKAAIISRGISEIIRFGERYGADFKTFSGLSGVGDLIVTCTSKHSRNRYVGECLGKGQTMEEIMKNMVMVAEGVPTTKAVYETAKEKEIEMPIIEALYSVLYEGKNPKNMIDILMKRELKEEFY
jgi:glycerol-3-phosphate dehydrogenase (NAD(P)+)